AHCAGEASRELPALASCTDEGVALSIAPSTRVQTSRQTTNRPLSIRFSYFMVCLRQGWVVPARVLVQSACQAENCFQVIEFERFEKSSVQAGRLSADSWTGKPDSRPDGQAGMPIVIWQEVANSHRLRACSWSPSTSRRELFACRPRKNEGVDVRP